MIHRVFSSLSTFKELEFHSGLNILIAKKESGSTDKQTRNRAGKTSLIEIIHFLSGANVAKDSIFRSESLKNESFGITFDFGGETVTATRSDKERSKLYVEEAGSLDGKVQLSNAEWIAELGEKIFDLQKVADHTGRKPTFRTLFPYFVRRQNSNAFITPEKQATMQQPVDVQTALLYLFDLDWQIASDWQKVRDSEKTLKELKKAAGSGVLGNLIGKASDLRTQLTLAEARFKEMREKLTGFHVLPQYRELETEADQLTRQINELANANVIDAGTIRDLEKAMSSEAPPPFDALESIYAEAGISLPGVVMRRYEEVQEFHKSVIRNRRDYLADELETAVQRIEKREKEKQALDQRRAVVMNLLKVTVPLISFLNFKRKLPVRQAKWNRYANVLLPPSSLKALKMNLILNVTISLFVSAGILLNRMAVLLRLFLPLSKPPNVFMNLLAA